MSYLFKALELLRGVDSLFALGTLLAHLGVTWRDLSGLRRQDEAAEKRPQMAPFTLHSLTPLDLLRLASVAR